VRDASRGAVGGGGWGGMRKECGGAGALKETGTWRMYLYDRAHLALRLQPRRLIKGPVLTGGKERREGDGTAVQFDAGSRGSGGRNCACAALYVRHSP